MRDFLEKVKGDIEKGIKSASLKGKELLEIKKLKKEMLEIQNSIENKFNALGKRVFEMLNRNTFDEEKIKADHKEILSLYKRISELEEEIKRIELETKRKKYGEDIIKCSKCGGLNKSDAKFCMSCGSPLEIEIKEEGKKCPACGTSLKESAKFCMRCGTKINERGE